MAELKHRLGVDSSNSSEPPSSDGLTRQKRSSGPSGGKRGKPLGHREPRCGLLLSTPIDGVPVEASVLRSVHSEVRHRHCESESRHLCPTCPSATALRHRSVKDSPVHVSTLASPGSSPYPASYPQRTDEGVGEHLPVSCCLTACRRSLLGPSCSHWGAGPSSRSAYPTPTAPGPQPGLPRSARVRRDRGGRPLYPETVVLSRLRPDPLRHLPLPSGQSYTPLLHPILRG